MNTNLIACIIFVASFIPSAVGCTPDQGYCIRSDSCCNKTCVNNQCTTCKQSSPCRQPVECCSKQCVNGLCVPGGTVTPPKCTNDGGQCTNPLDCCSGLFCKNGFCSPFYIILPSSTSSPTLPTETSQTTSASSPTESSSASTSKELSSASTPTESSSASTPTLPTEASQTASASTPTESSSGSTPTEQSPASTPSGSTPDTTTETPCLPDGAKCDSGCSCCSKVCTYTTCGVKN